MLVTRHKCDSLPHRIITHTQCTTKDNTTPTYPSVQPVARGIKDWANNIVNEPVANLSVNAGKTCTALNPLGLSARRNNSDTRL